MRGHESMPEKADGRNEAITRRTMLRRLGQGGIVAATGASTLLAPRTGLARQDVSDAELAVTPPQMLPLVGGWENFGGEYAPATYRTYGSLVVLSGLVIGKTWTIGRLPAELAPSQRLAFRVQAAYGQPAQVDILPDGAVRLASGSGSFWASLSGIAYTIGETRRMGLMSGWSSVEEAYGAPVVGDVGGFRVAQGVARGDRGHAVGQLGSRNRARHAYSVTSGLRVARLDVHPQGRIVESGGVRPDGWLGLGGIVMGPDEGNRLPLAPPWLPYARGYAMPSFHTEGGLTLLSGRIRHPGELKPCLIGGGLPAPETGRLIFGANSGDMDVRVDVLLDGRLGQVDDRQVDWLSLSGLIY